MNGAKRWKEFVSWWDREFPAGVKLDHLTVYQLANMIEDKVFELKHKKGLGDEEAGKANCIKRWISVAR